MTAFRVAQERDDALVRSLLRDNGISGWVEIAIEREPSFFVGANWLGSEWAFIGEDGGSVVGMYTAAVRRAYVNGREELLGYLGGLRIDARQRHRIRHLRAASEAVKNITPTNGRLPWWLTVIAEENAAAHRLAEARVKGLPEYQCKGAYVTFVLSRRRGRRLSLWRVARQGEAAAIVSFYNSRAVRYQCSPVLSRETVERIGLDRFLLFEQDGEMLGVVALWDQRTFKQVVVRRYRRPVGVVRPAYNLYARLFGQVPLPAAGRPLAQTFLAFLAVSDAALPRLALLVADALSHCRTPAAVLGLHAQHPFIVAIDQFKPIRYPARVYAVTFGSRVELDPRPVQPEAALL